MPVGGFSRLFNSYTYEIIDSAASDALRLRRQHDRLGPTSASTVTSSRRRNDDIHTDDARHADT
jgi:hypothetical protein